MHDLFKLLLWKLSVLLVSTNGFQLAYLQGKGRKSLNNSYTFVQQTWLEQFCDLS